MNTLHYSQAIQANRSSARPLDLNVPQLGKEPSNSFISQPRASSPQTPPTIPSPSSMSLPADMLPPIGTLPAQNPAVITSVLDTLFEPSAELQDLAVPYIQSLSSDQLQSYPNLVDHIQTLITDQWLGSLHRRGKATEELDEFLAAHPRLGEKKDVKSEMSRREQQAMNKDGENASEEEYRRKEKLEVELRRMNVVYEERFPGLRFV